MPAMNIKHTDHAVVFDMGGVLTLAQDQSCFAELAREFGLPAARLLEVMDRHRPAYDNGSADPTEYWTRVLGELCSLTTEAGLAGLEVQEAMARYFEWGYTADYLSWSRPRTDLHHLAGEILAAGGRLGIISNMPRTMDQHFLQTWPWLEGVPHKIWSGPERLAKPDTAIYRLFLERSGWPADQILFVDDRAENVAGAREAGMQGLHFARPEQDILTIRAWLEG